MGDYDLLLAEASPKRPSPTKVEDSPAKKSEDKEEEKPSAQQTGSAPVNYLNGFGLMAAGLAVPGTGAALMGIGMTKLAQAASTSESWNENGAKNEPTANPSETPRTNERTLAINSPKGLDPLAMQGDNTWRDDTERKGMLDGQIDGLGRGADGKFNGSGNTFIRYSANGKEYEAFKSDLHGKGDIRYGFRELGTDDKWQKVDEATTKTKLDEAHTAHMQDVKNHGDIDNYYSAQKLRSDLRELSDYKFSANDPALKALNGIGSQLDQLRDGKGGDLEVETLRTKFNEILDGNQALKDHYIANRLGDLGADLKGKISANDLKELSAEKALAKIDEVINGHRDTKQQLTAAETEKFKTDLQQFRERMKKLENFDTSSIKDPELKTRIDTLKQLAKSFATDPNKIARKYEKEELATLDRKRAEIEKNPEFQQARFNTREGKIELLQKYMQGKEQGQENLTEAELAAVRSFFGDAQKAFGLPVAGNDSKELLYMSAKDIKESGEISFIRNPSNGSTPNHRITLDEQGKVTKPEILEKGEWKPFTGQQLDQRRGPDTLADGGPSDDILKGRYNPQQRVVDGTIYENVMNGHRRAFQQGKESPLFIRGDQGDNGFITASENDQLRKLSIMEGSSPRISEVRTDRERAWQISADVISENGDKVQGQSDKILFLFNNRGEPQNLEFRLEGFNRPITTEMIRGSLKPGQELSLEDLVRQ